MVNAAVQKKYSNHLMAFVIVAVFFLAGCSGQAQISEGALPVWAASDSIKIFRDSLAQKENAVWSSKDSTIRLQGARNETIAFQVVLNGGEAGLTQTSVAASGLKGAQNTGAISQSQFQFFLEWYTCIQGEKDTRCYPDALIPFYDPYSTPERSVAAPFQVKPGENQPVWVDIKIPKDAEAGVYNGTLQVLSKEEPPRIIHILLTVLPFTIPDERHITAYSDLYGMGKEGVRNIFGDDWPVMVRYWVMAREHRFDFNSEGRELDPAASSMWAEDGQYEYNPQTWMAYDEYYGQVLRGEIFADGLPPNVWRLPFPEAKQNNLYGINCKYFQPSTWDKAGGCYDADHSVWENKIKSLALEIEAHFKEKEISGEWPKGTLERSFVYTIDEPKQNDYYYLYIKDYAALIHQAAPGIKFMLTEQPEEPLFGSVDIWAPPASTFSPKRMLERKNKGEKIWFYQAAEPYIGDHKLSADAIALEMWAWAAWKYHADAVFLWACNYWSSENPYTDPQVYEQGRATNNYGDGYIFYPGRMLGEIGFPEIEGPVSSIRMKMWRRGFLDYEYMWLAAQKGREKDVDVVVSGMVKSAMAEHYKEITDPVSCAKKKLDGQKTTFVNGKCLGACADFSNKACAYNEGVLIGPWDCDDGPNESGKYPQWWEDPRAKKFNGWTKDPDEWVRARYKIAALLTK